MIELLQSFEDRLDELAAEIQMQAAVNDIRKLGKSGALDTSPIADETMRHLLRPSSSSRRRSQYSGSVIELYAAWESFVELLIRAYVTECAASGTLLAANVCKRHLAKTMEVISLIQKGVSRYAGEDLALLLENATRVEKGEYSAINSVALSHHSANLRSSTLSAMLSDIGADQAWAQALRDTNLLSALRDSGLPAPHDNALYVLDDLCARRNDIAHGGEVVETFDETYQLAYLKSLRALGRAFFAALFVHAFDPDSSHYQLVGPYSERYQGRVAIVVAAAATFLEVGDTCVLVGADGSRSARRVTSIQLESIPQKSVLTVGEGAELGVQFDGRIAKKAAVYVKRTP
jgi:hypothetical protein